jgi:DNA-binding GntR family transcriptional regulator
VQAAGIAEAPAMDRNLTETQTETSPPSGPARPIRRQSLHARVVEKLRQLIYRGDIAAGERINEVEIAAALGVSRTPLREATKLLASEGLLELLPGRGARVRRFAPEEIRDHFEVIGALERHAVELAVVKLSAKSRNDLERLHEQMKTAFAEADPRAYFLANQKAHLLFVKLADSATLSALHETLTKKAGHERHVTLASKQRWLESMNEHAELLDAALAGDAARAGMLMLLHARKTGAAMAELAQRSLDS